MERPSLFLDGVGWLREKYSEYRFYQEYEIAWLVRCYIHSLIVERDLPYITRHNHPVIPDYKVDLAIIDPSGPVPVVVEAVEWKYEPDHMRVNRDYRPSQLNPCVVEWYYIAADVERIHACVEAYDLTTGNGARSAYSILIDEGDYHRMRNPAAPPGSQWLEWECKGTASGHVSVLLGAAMASLGA